MGEASRRDRRRYGLYFLAWTVLGLFLASRGLSHRFFRNEPSPWWHYVGSWVVGGTWVWALLTPAMLWLGRRFPIERERWPSRVGLHLAFGVAFALAQLVVESVVNAQLGLFPPWMSTFRGSFMVLLPGGIHNGILMYWAVLGAQWGVLHYVKYQERTKEALALELRGAELQSRLVNAQLSTLKMQLQPHFLFNTLNAIMVLVRQGKGREAEQMLGQLSDLLRCVLEDVDAQEVSLHRELEYLQLYLSIEQTRFQDRLRVEIRADPETLDAAVPQLGLQPIVENAIRHGLGQRSGAGRVEISASRVSANLELRVTDDGPGFSPDRPPPGNGIGLANTRARLQQLYGTQAQLHLDNGPRGGAVVTMVLPFRAPAGAVSEMPVHATDDADR